MSAVNEERPNQYRLEGDGVTILYSTSSIFGEPQFSYEDGERQVSRSGDEISIERTALGEVVTIELEANPDLNSVSASLLVPDVNLGDDNEAEIETVVILTTSRTSFGGPGLVQGALQSYRGHDLRGTAGIVEF